MGSSIALAMWFFVLTLTQDFTTIAKAAAEQALTFSILKLPHSKVERSSSHSGPYYKNFHVLCFQIRTGGTLRCIPINGINEKHT